MIAISFPFLAAWFVGAILAMASLVNITGPRRLREAMRVGNASMLWPAKTTS